jgi:omega-6 fatty acid desaturase (delta-12 desaturase)
MRSGKELILASKDFINENRTRSWIETIITLAGLIVFLTATFLPIPLAARIACSLICALFYVRMFIIYHDYQHHAILQGSPMGTYIMKLFGVFILAPQTIWKRSHDHHHTHNSKLTMHGIGSYPTISKAHYLKLNKTHRLIYLINRHPLTIVFGYITLFIYWLNVKSFFQSPRKHGDSLLALILHITAGILIYTYFGTLTLFISWITPFFIAFAMGSYLFYCQHNFPGAVFAENQDWAYDQAAIASTSFMKMNPLLQWFTGNIGFHHVHHLNSRIPFYRLPEAMKEIPEMHNPITTSWNPIDVWRCFRLKLWDAERGEMITLRELNTI